MPRAGSCAVSTVLYAVAAWSALDLPSLETLLPRVSQTLDKRGFMSRGLSALAQRNPSILHCFFSYFAFRGRPHQRAFCRNCDSESVREQKEFVERTRSSARTSLLLPSWPSTAKMPPPLLPRTSTRRNQLALRLRLCTQMKGSLTTLATTRKVDCERMATTRIMIMSPRYGEIEYHLSS
jgi:hypothetical protein